MQIKKKRSSLRKVGTLTKSSGASMMAKAPTKPKTVKLGKLTKSAGTSMARNSVTKRKRRKLGSLTKSSGTSMTRRQVAKPKQSATKSTAKSIGGGMMASRGSSRVPGSQSKGGLGPSAAQRRRFKASRKG